MSGIDIRYTIDKSDLAAIDWRAVTADLAADDFDNGRSPRELRLSFERAYAVSLGWNVDHLVSMARLLADGVCNALFTENHEAFYAELGFHPELVGMSRVVGTWLDRSST